jgi:transposase, IS5 family
MEKATRPHELTRFQKIKNKLISRKIISRKRFIVEQSYGTLKRLFKFFRASYMTLNKVKGASLRKAICFNLLKNLNKVTLPIEKMNNFQPGDVK